MKLKIRDIIFGLLVLAIWIFPRYVFSQAFDYQSDFSSQGWSVNGRVHLIGDALDVYVQDVFGADIRNSTNPKVIGNYAATNSPIHFSIEIEVESIVFNGLEVPRTLILELRNAKIAKDSPFPYVSIWIKLGELNSLNKGYHRYETTLFNPQASELPQGWFGTGDEDRLGNPKLPQGISLREVLENISTLSFNTLVPGNVYGYTNFKLKIKNIRIFQT